MWDSKLTHKYFVQHNVTSFLKTLGCYLNCHHLRKVKTARILVMLPTSHNSVPLWSRLCENFSRWRAFNLLYVKWFTEMWADKPKLSSLDFSHYIYILGKEIHYTCLYTHSFQKHQKSKFDYRPSEPHRSWVFHAVGPAAAFNIRDWTKAYLWSRHWKSSRTLCRLFTNLF